MGQSFHPSDHAVLVVDDDPFVRAEMVDLAEEAGFVAYEAKDGIEAIRLLETTSHIRILFTDIDMGDGPDGVTLAHAVRRRWPPVRIIVISGRVRPDEIDLPEGGKFFPKPYDADAVLAVMASCRSDFGN